MVRWILTCSIKQKKDVYHGSKPRNIRNKIKKPKTEKKRKTFLEVKFHKFFEFLRIFFVIFRESSQELVYICVKYKNKEIFFIAHPHPHPTLTGPML
jgi:hypothetical protein